MSSSQAKADLLAEAGRLLYGEQWLSALALALDVRPDTVRKWLSGRMDMPDNVLNEIATLVRERAAALEELAGRIMT